MSDVAQVVGVGLLVAGVIASGGFGLAALATYGKAMVIAGSMIYGSAAQRSAKQAAESSRAASAAAARAAFLSGLQDRTATNVSTEQYHRTVYGLNKVGGNIVAMFPSGEYDQYKTCVVIFTNHKINAYTKFWVAGKLVGTQDGDGNVIDGEFARVSTLSVSTEFLTSISINPRFVPGSVVVARSNGIDGMEPVPFTQVGTLVSIETGFTANISYQYQVTTSHLRILQHLGAPAEAADSYMTSTFPAQWTPQHTLEGHAYCVFVLNLNQAEFQGGPPSFQAEMQGKPLYDPRTSTTTYSDNNALVLLDYLTGPYMKIPRTALPIADYIAAANDCDDVVRTGAVYPQSNKRYTFNGVISSNESPKTILEQIAMSMCGTIDGNGWSVYAGKYRAPVMTLTQEDVVGSISITPGLGFQGTYNTVRGQYTSPASDYVATDFAPYVNTVYLTADGQEVSIDAQEPYTNNLTGIYSAARIRMEDSRNGLTLSGDFSYKTWALRPGDRVLFSSQLLGMSSKIFRVTDKSLKFGDPVQLTLKEDAPEIWDQLDATVADATPNTSLGDPFTVPLLPALTAESGTSTLLRAASGEIISRILVAWQPANYGGATVVDVQWRRYVSNTWESLTTSADNPSTYLTGVMDAEGYVVRARLRSVSLNAVGDWSYVNHVVIGKSEPPPNVASLTASNRTLTWTPVNVVDLAGYVLAFNYGTNTDWGVAAPLNTGVITESPYALPNAIAGQVTILIKAVDTTGNLSSQAATAFTILDAPVLSSILQTTDYGQMAYPGAVTGGTRAGTTLVADATDSFYGLDASSFYGASDMASIYTSATTSYGVLRYTTNDLVVTDALAGSKLTLVLSTLNAPTYTLEYLAQDLTSFYGLDVDSFYGPDVDTLYDDSAEVWLPWPGQLEAKNSVYRFRVSLGANPTDQPTVLSFIAILDAPDIAETLDDLIVSDSGTVIPYTSNFTQINNIQATLQSNGAGGVTVEVDKPTLTVRVYNSAHTAVSGAAVDITLRGY